jgi:hypothetical protein
LVPLSYVNLRCGFRFHPVESLQHLIRTSPDGDVFRQIPPLDRPRGIDQEFGRPCDIAALWPGAAVEKVVTPDRLRIYVGENRKCVTRLLPERAAGFRRIDADRDDAKPAGLEGRELFLETPQLGVTE